MEEWRCPVCGTAERTDVGPNGSRCARGHFTARDAIPGTSGAARSGHPPGLIALASVRPSKVRWLWPRRVPIGKLTVLDGDPGLGKSLVTLDLAARVSTGGEMPDGTFGDLDGPRAVILLSAEDGVDDTIVPRLEAAGANRVRAYARSSVPDKGGERLPSLADVAVLEADILETGAALVVIDPLMAFLAEGLNAHRDQDIRRALAPLAQLAERTGAAILVVRHLNKAQGGNPLYRGGGSIGIIGAARSGLLVARDPDDPDGDRRILATTKSNLSAPPPALAYRAEVTADDVARVVWEGPTGHTAAALLAADHGAGDRGEVREADRFLGEALAAGPRPVVEVEREARSLGISPKQLRGARERLGVVSGREGFGRGGAWMLTLPGRAIDAHHGRIVTIGAQPPELGIYRNGRASMATREGPLHDE